MGNKSSLMLQDEEIVRVNQETGFTPTQIVKLYTRFTHLDRSNCGGLTRDDLLSIPELAINPLCDRLLQMFFSATSQENERINFVQFMKVLATFRPSDNDNSIGGAQEWLSDVTVEDRSGLETSGTQADHSSHRNTNIKTRDSNDRLKVRRKHVNDSFISTSGRFTGTSQANVESTTPGLESNNAHSDKMTAINLSNGLKRKLHFVFRIYDADNDGKISFADLRSILKMMVGNFIEDVQLDKIATRAFVEVDIDNDGYIEFREFCNVFSQKDLDDRLRVKFFN